MRSQPRKVVKAGPDRRPLVEKIRSASVEEYIEKYAERGLMTKYYLTNFRELHKSRGNIRYIKDYPHGANAFCPRCRKRVFENDECFVFIEYGKSTQYSTPYHVECVLIALQRKDRKIGYIIHKDRKYRTRDLHLAPIQGRK